MLDEQDRFIASRGWAFPKDGITLLPGMGPFTMQVGVLPVSHFTSRSEYA